MANKDLFHGQGNSTAKVPIKVTNKAGKTDPGQKDPGNTTPVKRVIQDGWCK